MTGIVVLLLAGIYEVRTKRDALFPPIVFKDRTIGTSSPPALGKLPSHFGSPVITLAVTFLHNFAFNAGTFYLALYLQVRDFCSIPVLSDR